MVIRSNRWFGGRPDADRLNNYRVTMQLVNGYFGLIVREPSIHLPSVCESEIEESESQDSDSSSSHGHHSRGRHSRGWESRDSDRSHGHRHHRGGRGSGRGGHHHRGRPGHIHGQYQQYRQNPYSPYYPRPRLPYNCEQPTTPALSTRRPTTTKFTTSKTNIVYSINGRSRVLGQFIKCFNRKNCLVTLQSELG